MKMLSLFTLLVFIHAGFAAEYKLTGENTKIEWTGTKPGGKHTGGFKTLTGTAKVENGTIMLEVEIDCDSLHSDDDKLTGHLKSPDFFNVREHAKSKFVTTKVEKKDNKQHVTGKFTLLGKEKEITFPAEIMTDDGFKLKSEFKINRTDYGMTYGKGKIDDDVLLKVTVEAK